MDTKTCKKCGIEKPIDSYRLNVKGKDWRLATCNDCISEQNAKKYEAKKAASKAGAVCSKCGSGDLYANGTCKPCRRRINKEYKLRNPEKIRAYNEENKEKIAEYMRQYTQKNKDPEKEVARLEAAKKREEKKQAKLRYNEENKEKIEADKAAREARKHMTAKEKKADYYKRNAEQIKAKVSAYASANKDKVKETTMRWRQNNRDRMYEKIREYSEKNKEKISSYLSAYKQENRDKVKTYGRNRRSKMANAGGKLSQGIEEKLFALQKGKCPCCGKPLGDDFHLDHVMPIALGGANSDDNVQLLRAECNMKKKAKHPIDYMQSKGFLL